MIDFSFFSFTIPAAAPTHNPKTEEAKLAYEAALRTWDTIDAPKRLQVLKDVLTTHLADGHYTYVSIVLHFVASQFLVSSPPNNVADFQSSRYLESLFYQYAACIQVSLFELEVNTDLTELIDRYSLASTQSASLNLEQVYKRATQYFAKIKRLGTLTTPTQPNPDPEAFLSSKLVPEIQYYYAICWIRLLELFKKGQYREFHRQFIQQLQPDALFGDIATEVLQSDQCAHIRYYLVVFFAISLALCLPTRELAFWNSSSCILHLEAKNLERTRNIITDLFTSSTSCVWYPYLVALSETDFGRARTLLLAESDTIHRQFKYVPGRSQEFLAFFLQTMDIKCFLMVISNAHRISLGKLVQILGHAPETSAELVRLFISVISILNLGELGVGYDIAGDFFFNNGQSPTSKLQMLEFETQRLGESLEGDGIAELVHGALIERYFS